MPGPDERVNILIVDDRPENVLALQAVLSDPSYNVVTAATGAEALKKVLKFDFAVILLDVVMPAMGGFETARLILERQASRQSQIIFLTAAGGDLPSIHEGYALGAVDYLIKPIEPEIVRAKVAVFVDLFLKTRQIKRQEEALRAAERARSALVIGEREAEYEATFEKAGVGIGHVALGGRLLRVNQKFCEIVGYGRQEALLLDLEDLSHPDDYARTRRGLDRLRRGELESFQTEGRVMRKGGRSVRVDLTVSLLRGQHGLPKKFIAIIEDATERKRAQEGQQVLAHASKILLNSLDFNSTLGLAAQCMVPLLADCCVIALAPGGREGPTQVSVAHLDARVARRLEEVFSRGRLALGHQAELVPEVTEGFLLAWAPDAGDRQVLSALSPQSVMVVPLKVRGSSIGSLTLIFTERGRSYTAADLEIAEDLARRTALAIENARLYKSAQDLIGARDEFLSIASHELRTPLTPLQLQLQRLLGVRGHAGIEAMPRDQVRAMLQRSAAQVTRLAALIDSLLDVSRITAGRLTLSREQVELSAMAREVVARLGEAAAGAGSTIALDVATEIVGQLDPLRVEQVLVNLLSNAIKYGQGKPIEVRLALEGDQAVMTVKDRGMGIAADQLPVIFERFERGAAARSYGGLGLGLYIARQIVDAHGGSISVTSEAGQGTCFTVRLPLERQLSARTPPVETRVAVDRPTQARSVLLVEDDEDIRACVAEILRSEGYAVTQACNGREGLERLSRLEKRPDVIVLDLMMPVLNGVGFSAEQRKVPEWSEIPVVVLSADGRYAEAPAPIPGAIFVKKPVDMSDLLEVVGRVCRKLPQPPPRAAPN